MKHKSFLTFYKFSVTEKFYNSQIKELQNMINILKPSKKDGTIDVYEIK